MADKLTEEIVRQYVGETNFQRGKTYFHDGMIVHTRRADTTLKADCHGSSGNLYRVTVTIDDGRIHASKCACPVDGPCKHIAALLLTWLARPDDFREVEATDAVLAHRSKDELIALIKQMLLRVPDLESLLELPLPRSKKTNHPVNPEVYRRQVAAAFRASDYEWGTEASIANQVHATLDLGSGFLEESDIANAFAVFESVTQEVLEQFGQFHDESGELSELVARGVDGLGACLQAEQTDAARREQILNALFAVYRFDVDYGGVGLGEDVPGLIVAHANATEKQRVAEWVRAAMHTSTHDKFTRDWHQREYGGFLLQLEADKLDDEAYLRICREAHRLADLIERLLTLKRVDEARRESEQASDYELLDLVELFTQAGYMGIAEAIVLARAQKSKDTRLAGWLMHHYEMQHDAAKALVWARQIFDAHSTLVHYQQIQHFAENLGTWQVLREELQQALQRKKEFDVLTEIHLAENNIGAAIETVVQVQQGFGMVYPNLRIDVARAAEPTHPRDALRLYANAAEDIIKQRDRGLYDRACEYLVCVRRLYQQLSEEEVWNTYLQQIKSETKMLRAFKAEMSKVGL